MKPRRVLQRLEAAERASGTKPPPRPPRPKMTTSESRDSFRAAIRQHIADGNAAELFELVVDDLMGRCGLSASKAAEYVRGLFAGQPDSDVIVAALEAWLAGLPEGHA
jgi:hypothetical protein